MAACAAVVLVIVVFSISPVTTASGTPDTETEVEESEIEIVVSADLTSVSQLELSDINSTEAIEETVEQTEPQLIEQAPIPTAPAEDPVVQPTTPEQPIEDVAPSDEVSQAVDTPSDEGAEEPVAQEEAPAAPYSQSDLDLLAALVWAEAGDQDFIGQRIVADCVCNRVRTGWASTISGVIYQPGQFSVVANGRLNQGFYNATPENYEAARLALSGDHYDTQVIYFSMYYCANGVFAYQHGDHCIGY